MKTEEKEKHDENSHKVSPPPACRPWHFILISITYFLINSFIYLVLCGGVFS